MKYIQHFMGQARATLRHALMLLLATFALALAALTLPARDAQAQTTSYSDLWWNPAESGWGINLNQQGDIIFATWFTYGDGGRNEWYVMSNASKQADGSFKGDIYQTTGVPFAQINGQAARQGLATVGSGTFRFSANNTKSHRLCAPSSRR